MTLCEELDPLLAERASGPVSPEDLARLDDHLPVCERCRRELAAYEATFALVRETPPVPRLASIAPAALGAWKRQHRRRIAGYALGAGFLAAAAAAGIALAPALLGKAGRGVEAAPAPEVAAQAWEPDVDAALQASVLLEAEGDDSGYGDDLVLATVDAADVR